jgi:hypothetical protein
MFLKILTFIKKQQISGVGMNKSVVTVSGGL